MAQQIGLEAVLDLSSYSKNVSKYLDGLERMGKATGKFDKETANFGAQVTKNFQTVGKVVLGATAAIAAAGVAAGVAIGKFTVDGIRKAADLESQMSRIAATLNTTREAAQPLKDLIMQLALDPKLVVTTNEAADAIENLAKNGVSMKDILDGVARSVVLLANSTGAEFGAAADVVTDVMAQFNLTAEDTAHAVDQITGVTNLSKLTFDDYRLAIAQAGGAAGTLGVSFEDFNSVLIATNANFASGSDLGTSFKNFLTTLPGKSDKAKEAIAALGLEFFDAQGNMRSMAEISEELNQAFMHEVEFSSQVSNMTAEQAGQKKLLEQQIGRLNNQLFLYQAGVNGVGESEEANAEAVAKLNEQYANAMGAYEGLATSMGTTVTVRRNLTEQERIAYAQTIFGVDSMRLAFGMAEAGEVAYTDLATATKALGLEGKQLVVAQESLSKAFEDGKITMFEFGTAQAAAIDASAQAAERMRNFKGVMDILGGAIEGLQIMIGDAFLPILTELANMAVALVSAYGPNLVKPFQDFGAALGLFFTSIKDGQTPFEAFTTAMGTFGTQGTAIAAAMGSIAFSIGAVVVTIGMVLQPVTDAIGKFVEWQDVLIVLGIAVGSVVVPAIIGMIVAITPVVATIGAAILAVAALRTAWESDFLGIQTTTTTVVATITTAFGPFAVAVQTHMQGALTEVKAFVSGSETDFAHLSSILVAFQESVRNLFTAIGDAVANVLPQWAAQFDALAEKFPPLGAAIETLQSTWETLVDFFGPSIARIGDSLSAFGKHLTTLGDEFNALLKAVQSTITKISPLIQGLGTVIGAVLGVLAVTTLNALAAVFENLGKIIEATVNQMTLMIQSFGEIVDDMVNLVTALIEGDWAGAWQSFNELGQDALALFIGSLENLSTVVGAVFLIVRDTIINTLADLGVNVPAELEKLTAAFQQWIENVATAFNETDWAQLGMDAITGIWSGITMMQSLITGTFIAIGRFAYNAFIAIDWLGLGSSALNKVKSGVSGAASSLLSQMRTIAQNAIKAFLNQDWAGLGRDVIAGILKGLKNNAQKVIDYLAGLAQEALKAALGVLGIESPSKEFMKVGEFIVEGWIVGMKRKEGDLFNAIGQMTGRFTQSVVRSGQDAIKAFSGIIGSLSNVAGGKMDKVDLLDWISIEGQELVPGGQQVVEQINAARKLWAFLQQQGDLISTIRDMGGDPSEILQGVKLGGDASPMELAQIVARMMESVNTQLERSIQAAAHNFEGLINQMRKGRETIQQVEDEFANKRLSQLEQYKLDIQRLDENIAQAEQQLLMTGTEGALSTLKMLDGRRADAIESLREYITETNRLEDLLTGMQNRRSSISLESIEAQFENLDQLGRYKQQVTMLEQQIASVEQTIMREHNRDLIRILEDLDDRRTESLASIKEYLRQSQRLETSLARMPTSTDARVQQAADAFRERLIDPLVASFDQLTVARRDTVLTEIDRLRGVFEQIRGEFAKNRLSPDELIEQMTASQTQLDRYKNAITQIDQQIANAHERLLSSGNTTILETIRNLDTQRAQSIETLRQFLIQTKQLQTQLARMPVFRGERAQAGADAFKERFIDPLVAGFDQMSVEMRGNALQQLDRYLDMLRVYETRMQNAGAATKSALKAAEGFGDTAQQRIENLLSTIYDVGTPTASRDNAIQTLRDFAASLNAIRAELTTRGASRESTEGIIERAMGGFDQLSAYKTTLADLDKRIQSITDTIEETGNANLLPQLRSLDVARNLSTDELKNFLVQVSQLEGVFRGLKNLTGPGETSAQRFVDEQIQPILDAFSAPMRPQEREAWLRAAKERVALVNTFINQMRAVEKLQQRIADQEGFAHLADEFAAMADIAMPEAQRIALLNQLTAYISQMERLFALQRDISVGVGADPLVERFKSERLDTIAKQLEDINLSEAERVRLIEQYRMEQEKILAIQTKQNQLEFLQQQLSLLDKVNQLAKEEGFKVDVPNIIKGIGFGVNASMDDLLALVGRVIDETVRFTNFKLGIKSPSKVFAEIGGYMMQGLARGIESTMMRPINSLSGAISELPYALGGRSLTLNMGGVNISNGMDEVMFESRVRQILDKAFP